MLVIGIVALVVFGPKKLPEIGRALGRGLREFRKAASDVMEETEGSGRIPAAPHILPDCPDAGKWCLLCVYRRYYCLYFRSGREIVLYAACRGVFFLSPYGRLYGLSGHHARVGLPAVVFYPAGPYGQRTSLGTVFCTGSGPSLLWRNGLFVFSGPSGSHPVFHGFFQSVPAAHVFPVGVPFFFYVLYPAFWTGL